MFLDSRAKLLADSIFLDVRWSGAVWICVPLQSRLSCVVVANNVFGRGRSMVAEVLVLLVLGRL